MDGQQQVGPGCFGCGGTLAGLQVGAAVGGQQGRKAVIRRQFLVQQLGGAQCDVALPHAVGLTAPVLGPDVGVDAPVPGVDGHHILPRRGGLGGRLRLRGRISGRRNGLWLGAGVQGAAAVQHDRHGHGHQQHSRRIQQPPHHFGPAFAAAAALHFPRGLPGSCGFGYHTGSPLCL